MASQKVFLSAGLNAFFCALLCGLFVEMSFRPIGVQQKSELISEIVIVNIGELDRTGIAKQLEIISQYQPKVVGIDAFFRKPKHSDNAKIDSALVAGDSALSRALRKIPNMVLGIELIEDEAGTRIVDVKKSNPMFLHKNVRLGYLDLISSDEGGRLASYCSLKETISDSLASAVALPKLLLSFPMQMALHYNREKVNYALQRRNEFEAIYYYGNVPMVNAQHKPIGVQKAFQVIDVEDVLSKKVDLEILRGKIVIMGYLGPDLNTYGEEDRFFYRNKNTGALEECYGVLIHANVCAMILRGEFIDK